MSTSAHIALISRQELEKLTREHIHLKTGDRLEGKVTEVREDGKAVVDFGKFQAALEIKAPVQKGDFITAVVVEKGKQIKLKLEQIQSQTKQDIAAAAQKTVKPAEDVQARAAEKLQQQTKTQTEQEQQVREEIKIPTDKNKQDFYKVTERVPQDLKDSLVKLRQILQPSENVDIKDIKNLSSEIKTILNTLQSYSDALDVGEKIVKPVVQLNTNIRDSGVLVEKEGQELLAKIQDTADRISKLKNLEQLPEIKHIIDKELKPQLQQLRETIDQQAIKAEPANQRSLYQIRRAADDLLEHIEKALEKLPDKIKTTERIETLLNEIKNIRQTLETTRETLDRSSQIVEQVSHLKGMMERAEMPPAKEVEAIIARLSAAAEKINQIKSPEQIPELNTIIDHELRPNLSALREMFETLQTMTEIKQQVEALQRDIEITLVKLPDKAQSTQDVQELLNDIANALDKIADFSYIVDKGQFTEDISTLFENIKIALSQLQSNLQSGSSPFTGVSPEVKDILANLQLNFNVAGMDMEKAVTQQVAQLQALIEAIQDSGLAADKQVEALLATLTEIVNQLSDLKENQQWQQVLQTLYQQLRPALRALKHVFDIHALRSSIPDAALQESMTTIANSIAHLEQRIDGSLEKVSTQVRQMGQTELAEFLDKTNHLPKEVRDIFTKLPRSLQTPENLTRLSQAIQETLARYTQQMPPSPNTSATSALPMEVRNMLSTLHAHFEPLDIGESAVKLTPKLKSLVEDSGIFFEKKIQDVIARLTDASARISSIDNLNQLPEIRNIINNDLKPNLLLLREYFNSDRFPSELRQQDSLETIKNAVEDLINNINSQQGRAVETQIHQQPVMVFTFNLPLKGGEEAQLKVFYNKGKKKREEGEFKLSLLLNMEKLGEIRTDFSHRGKNLNITFFVKSYKIKEHIEAHLDEIKEPLGPEFKALNFKVMVSEEKIATFDLEPLEPGIISDKAVDVKV